MKNSRSSWLRCSVASVVTGVVAARLMTGAPTALPSTEEFRTFLSFEFDLFRSLPSPRGIDPAPARRVDSRDVAS
jgi:hypothetical protein